MRIDPQDRQVVPVTAREFGKWRDPYRAFPSESGDPRRVVVTDDVQSAHELLDDDRLGLDTFAFLYALVAEGNGCGCDGILVRRQDGLQDRRTHGVAAAGNAERELRREFGDARGAGVAGQAGISRSWLYSQPDIRAEIARLQDATSRSGPAPIPASQRASDASLLRRLEAAHAERTSLLEERTRLREENARLRRQLAIALGEQRQAGIGGSQPLS